MYEPLHDLVTPELRFLAACSYLPQTREGRLRQRELLEEACVFPLEPERLWKAILRHRISALAEEVLRRHSMPWLLGELWPALTQHAMHSRLESLRLAAESKCVSKMLLDGGVEHTFIKGPGLSNRIYSDAGLRQANDLDILVRSSAVAASIEILRSEGWALLRHRGMWSRSSLYRWIAERRLRHFQLFHPGKRLLIELHWRLEHAHIPKLDALWRAYWSEDGNVSGAEFLYLCLHGSSHGWIRMKWIGDIQAILDQRPNLWAETRRLSTELCLGPVLAQTILLRQALFNMAPGRAARGIVAAQPQASELASCALKTMQAQCETACAATTARRLHGWNLDGRLPCGARLTHLLRFVLVDAADLEGWDRPAALLAALPLMRVSKLMKGYLR